LEHGGIVSISLYRNNPDNLECNDLLITVGLCMNSEAVPLLL